MPAPVAMPPVREEWLARHTEPIIEPELRIIDPHHHLWDRPGWRYCMPELLADFGCGHTIVASVFVECRSAYRTEGPEALRPVGETEWVAAEAAASGRPGVCAGIVAHVDLRLGADAGVVLKRHQQAAEGRLRGIRHISAWHADAAVRSTAVVPPPGLLADPAFRAGFAGLAPLGLSFDAWLYHPQLPELLALAHAFPETTIVLDHLGGPVGTGPYAGRRDDVFATWRASMTDLAACPNVVVKLGGLGMGVGGFDLYKRDDPPASDELARLWAPYIENCVRLFGPARCMFESNFPVCKASFSYAVLWNAFKRLTRDWAAGERDALFRGTAAAVYRLDLEGTSPRQPAAAASSGL